MRKEYFYDNPLPEVDGVSLPCVSHYQWSEQDISAETAGRTEDMDMHKERKGQAVTLEVGWKNISIFDASRILLAFDSEYVHVVYLDAKTGDFVDKDFYVGDRTAPLYSAKLGVWESISFRLIEKKPVDISKGIELGEDY